VPYKKSGQFASDLMQANILTSFWMLVRLLVLHGGCRVWQRGQTWLERIPI